MRHSPSVVDGVHSSSRFRLSCHKTSSPSQTRCSRRVAVVPSINVVCVMHVFRENGLRWMINILVSGAGEPFSRDRCFSEGGDGRQSLIRLSVFPHCVCLCSPLRVHEGTPPERLLGRCTGRKGCIPFTISRERGMNTRRMLLVTLLLLVPAVLVRVRKGARKNRRQGQW